MMHRLLNAIDKRLPFPKAEAHCDIPCGIYDPSTATIAALTVIRLLGLINGLESKESLSLADQATLSRLVREKEIHTEKVKAEIRIIWGDFFKASHVEQNPDCHTLVHNIMLAGSACRQHIDPSNGEKLLELINQFAEHFWEVKGVASYRAISPYAPAKEVVYPDLKP